HGRLRREADARRRATIGWIVQLVLGRREKCDSGEKSFQAAQPMRLKGKVALITGGGAGIGAATAEIFCREGARVLPLDIDPQSLQRAKRKLKARAEILVGDVADPLAANAAVAKALKQFGRLDILVNNAAARNYSAVAAATADEWHDILQANLI